MDYEAAWFKGYEDLVNDLVLCSGLSVELASEVNCSSQHYFHTRARGSRQMRRLIHVRAPPTC